MQEPDRRSSHVIPALRSALPWAVDRPFKVLSIDGGGIKGIFPAAILTEIERRFSLEGSVGEYFDLITGTSTGGIIALALGAGMTAEEVLSLYLEFGAEVFTPSVGTLGSVQRAYQRIRGFWRYRYDRVPLRKRLEKFFGATLLGESTRRLCIPAFDGNYNEVHVFKTPHHPDFRIDWSESMVDVALATAAAPTFFSVFESKGRRFADGGIWANNPIMIGLVDALTCYALPRRAIHILSIGCGDKDMPFTRGQFALGGMWHWRAIIDAAIRLQGQSADGQARALVGADQVLRISPRPPAAYLEMDDFSGASACLPTEAVWAVDHHIQRLAPFVAAPSPAFHAHHGPRKTASAST